MNELNIISLGAGVQSSCMSLMFARGELKTATGKPIDAAIFADTGAEAVRVDTMVRDSMPGLREKVYLHNSRVPLDEVDLSTEEDRGQTTFYDAWNNECEGMCGN